MTFLVLAIQSNLLHWFCAVFIVSCKMALQMKTHAHVSDNNTSFGHNWNRINAVVYADLNLLEMVFEFQFYRFTFDALYFHMRLA